jgi:spore coat polysaccharide biosynthesis protein SpsF
MKKQPQLALGTVQLGVPYGIANASGMPSQENAIALIGFAIRAGISTIDTARAYGEAERRVGLAIQQHKPPRPIVVTKLDPLSDHDGRPDADAVQAALASLDESRKMLQVPRLDAVLLHRAVHRVSWNGAVWKALLAERDHGLIGQLGVSVQTPAEALEALQDPAVTRLQLPYNLLDHRWDESGVVTELRSRPGVVVDVRSALLQGILSDAPSIRWSSVSGITTKELMDQVRALAKRLNRASALDLALAFVRAQDWIDNIVVGVETSEQLQQNLALFATPELDRTALGDIRRELPRMPDTLLDPSNWANRMS